MAAPQPLQGVRRSVLYESTYHEHGMEDLVGFLRLTLPEIDAPGVAGGSVGLTGPPAGPGSARGRASLDGRVSRV